jgi:hypothetical protein
MSVTIYLRVDSLTLKCISDDDVVNILADKIRENGFELDCFYYPYTVEDKKFGGYKKGFKFDLKAPQDEEYLKTKLDGAIVFDEIKIYQPGTIYESIIELGEFSSNQLEQEKIKEIKDFIALEDKNKKHGELNPNKSTSKILYLKVYSYSKHQEIYNNINNKKQDFNIISIKLNQSNKIEIGQLSRTSLNLNEIHAFFQQEDYDGVIKDLRQFISSICEFLSTLPNTSVNSSDANPIEVLEPIEKSNSEEPESSSSSGSSVANPTSSKPKLRPRPQLIDSSNSNSTEVPEPIEKANGKEPEFSSSSDEISTESKSIE